MCRSPCTLVQGEHKVFSWLQTFATRKTLVQGEHKVFPWLQLFATRKTLVQGEHKVFPWLQIFATRKTFVQGEHKVFPWLQTFATRKLPGIQTFLSLLLHHGCCNIYFIQNQLMHLFLNTVSHPHFKTLKFLKNVL
jgi:hypothetical protein